MKTESANTAQSVSSDPSGSIPWLGAFAATIAMIHGIFIGRIGFFWDDWMILLVREKLTPAAYFPYYAVDRPTSAWVNALFYGLPRDNPSLWRLTSCALTFAIAALLFRLLNSLWRERRTANGVAVLIFLAAPLFSQTYITITYTQHHLQYILFLLSLLATLRAGSAQRQAAKSGWTAAALALMTVGLTVTEFFAFAELVRFPILLILAMRRNEEKPALKSLPSALKSFLPYGLVWAGFVLYRMNFARWFPILEADSPELIRLFRDDPADAIRAAFELLFTTLAVPFFNFPGKMLTLDLVRFFEKTRLLLASIAAGGGFALFRFLRAHEEEDKPEAKQKIETERMIFAGCLLLTGIAPFVLILSSVFKPDDPYHIDRTYYVAAPAVAIIFESAVRALVEKPRMRAVLFAAVFALCAYQHELINDEARLLTLRQQSFYRQIKTRLPALENQTALVDTNVVFPEQGAAFTASAINILYPNPFTIDEEIPIWVYAVGDRSYADHPGFHTRKRIFRFNAPKENAILIDYDNPFANCVWVFNADDADHPHISEIQRSWIEHTALNRVQPAAPGNPETIDEKYFGKEDPDAWCGYYQRAAYARQAGDLRALAEITNAALSAGYRPGHRSANSPYEWIPFIESLYEQGETALADELRREALAVDPAYRASFDARFPPRKDGGNKITQ